VTQLPITAVIPAYNREGLVGRAIDSVMRQRGFQVAEVLVVDDGSADRTSEVAERHGARVVRHDRNRGLPTGRNTGLREATQPWVAYLDSDDEWMPHLLATLWPLRGDHILVGGGSFARAATPEGDYYGGTLQRRPEIVEGPAKLLERGQFIGPSGVLVRREPALAAGGSDESLPRVGGGEDIDLWIRLLEHGTAVVSPLPVAIYHLAGEGAAEVQGDLLGQIDAFESIVNRYLDRPWATPAVLARARGTIDWSRLRLALRAGDTAQALRLAAGLALDPRAARGAFEHYVRSQGYKRRVRAVTHDGQLRAAVLPGADRGPEQGWDPGEAVVDLRSASTSRSLWSLVRRPPARVYAKTRMQMLAAQAAGVAEIVSPFL
jgi:glycosyltransferase involved in cell wall biosynthesis